MPIYEYRCEACGKETEVLVRGGKEPTTCEGVVEACQSKGKLRRLISRAGIIFKGTGFHVNDYSGNSKSSKATTSGDSSSSSSSDSGSSTKSESKSESKSTATAAASSD